VYLVELCVPVADVMGRRNLRSATRGLLNFPRYNMTKLWPTSIFVRRPSCLELTARALATNHFNRPFQALSKNVFIRADIALSALGTFLFSGLYKFTYLLTYYLLPASTLPELFSGPYTRDSVPTKLPKAPTFF